MASWDPGLHPRNPRNGQFIDTDTAFSLGFVPKIDLDRITADARTGLKLRASIKPLTPIAFSEARSAAINVGFSAAMKRATGASVNIIGPRGPVGWALTGNSVFVRSKRGRELFLDPVVQRRLSTNAYARYERSQRRVDTAASVVDRTAGAIAIVSMADRVTGGKITAGATRYVSDRAARNRINTYQANLRGIPAPQASLRPRQIRVGSGRGAYKITTMGGRRIKP